jgi:hypothetical protein
MIFFPQHPKFFFRLPCPLFSLTFLKGIFPFFFSFTYFWKMSEKGWSCLHRKMNFKFLKNISENLIRKAKQNLVFFFESVKITTSNNEMLKHSFIFFYEKIPLMFIYYLKIIISIGNIHIFSSIIMFFWIFLNVQTKSLKKKQN